MNRQKIVSAITAFLAVSLLYLVFHLTGIGCPIRFLTGISCPGCGMTRAVLFFLQFRFADAFHYHPLVFLLPVGILIFLLKRHIPGRIYRFLTVTAIILFIAVYLLRMCIIPNNIVFFHPANGFFFRAIKKIFII